MLKNTGLQAKVTDGNIEMLPDERNNIQAQIYEKVRGFMFQINWINNATK